MRDQVAFCVILMKMAFFVAAFLVAARHNKDMISL